MASNLRKGPNTTPLPSIPNLHLDASDPRDTCSSPPNAGAAYERKKQRAKDARIKLNEAIEHLSISMSLAGSQSKHRNTLLSRLVMTTESRAKSLQTSDECAKLAEQAKK
jgi:hypothetical protein